MYYTQFRNERNSMNTAEEKHFSGREKYNYLALLRDKLVFGQYVASLGFPTPKNTFIYQQRNLYNLSTGKIAGAEDLLAEDNEYFCKLIYGECGKGIYKVSVKGHILYVDGKERNISDFFMELGDNSFLFQEAISQHETISSIYPLSINTMRIVTLRDANGVPQYLDSIIRIGAGGNVVDNWAAGGLVVGINEDGTMRKAGIREFKVNGEVYHTVHPDTGVSFEGIKIPFFKESIEMAKRLHSFMPTIGAIGWDVAITPDGPCFIEGNDNFELSLNQVGNGGLKKKWYKILGKK